MYHLDSIRYHESITLESQALELCDESYYESVEWNEKYLDYRMKHDFKNPAKKAMKKDMLSHLRQREDWLVAVTFSVLLALLYLFPPECF